MRKRVVNVFVACGTALCLVTSGPVYAFADTIDDIEEIEVTGEEVIEEEDANDFELVDESAALENELVTDNEEISEELSEEISEEILADEELIDLQEQDIVVEEDLAEGTDELLEEIEDVATEVSDSDKHDYVGDFIDIEEESVAQSESEAAQESGLKEEFDEENDGADAAIQDGAVTKVSVIDYGAVPNDGNDDAGAINAAIKAGIDAGGYAEVYIPAGKYDLNGCIYVYSNMSIIADANAVFTRSKNSGSKIVLMTSVAGNNSGYNLIQNFEISGGTWNANSSPTEDTSVFIFGHGNNIKIHDLTVSGSTNHMINVSSCKNVTINNVTLKSAVEYTGNSSGFWGDSASDSLNDKRERYKYVEAIHTDYAGPGENLGESDGTVPDTVLVSNCTFDGVLAGVGTHRENSPKAKNVTVKDCYFKYVRYGACFNAYSFENFTYSNNKNARATMAVKGFQATGTAQNNSIYVNAGEEYYGVFNFKESTVTLKNNTITGGNADGIYLGPDTKATLVGNTISSVAKDGIKLDENGKCTIFDNKIKDCRVGINVLKSRAGNNICNNKITAINGRSGAMFSYAGKGNVFNNNKISGTYTDVGLMLTGTSGDIKYNNISGCMKEPIMCYGVSGYSASANIIGNTTRSSTSGKNDIILIGDCGSSKIGLNKMNSAGIAAINGAKYTKVDTDPNKKAVGWVKVGNSYYYINSKGAKVVGWKKISGKWYYMSSKGIRQTGWKMVGGKWYYMNSKGVMQTGWKKIDGKWYYLNSSGERQTGWKKIDGKWYYLSAKGVMKTGWKKLSGKWYYMNSKGVMQTGWKKIDGKWYYFDKSSGAMAVNTTIDGYYVDKNGVRQ